MASGVTGFPVLCALNSGIRSRRASIRASATIQTRPSSVKGWLLVLGFVGSLQQGVAEADTAIDPDFLGIRTSESHEAGHACEQTTVYRFPIEVHDANNPTHLEFPIQKVLVCDRLARGDLDKLLFKQLIKKLAHVIAKTIGRNIELGEQ